MVLLLGGLSFMFVGPFTRQVLGYNGRELRAWRMYRDYALNTCKAQFVDYKTGSPEPIDRLKLLYDYDSWRDAPRSRRNLNNVGAIRKAGKALCKARKSKDIRVTAKCASHGGWVPFDNDGQSLCRSSTPRSKRPTTK